MRSNHSARRGRLRRTVARAALAAAIAACLPVYTAVAQAPQAAGAEAATRFDIPAGELGAALDRFSTQSGLQVAYQRELVAGRQVPALSGQLTWREALERLLAGSGLEYQQVNGTMIAIRRSEAAGDAGAGTNNPARPAAEPQAAAAGADADVTEMDRMTVTGTRIRGGVSPSPTLVLDEIQFREEGFADLGEVIRSIPQNFSGGQSPGVTRGASLGSPINQNITGGSALNLRGLGPDASLTLLNGRRLSYDGYAQAVDISAIPIAAVSRVEVVPDGASAIYGSDAVGGVANVVLRRDFEGVALEASYGDSAEGGLTRESYTATAGTTWNSGGLIATFKKSDIDPIYADQRDYTQSMLHPQTIYNGSTLRSGLFSAHQSIGESAELRLDALRTKREQISYWGTPDGYNFNPYDSKVTLVAPSFHLLLPSDWSLIAGISRSQGEGIYRSYSVSDGISTLQSHGCDCNETRAWELGAEGPLLQYGQRELRLAVGVGGRTTEYLNHTFISGGHVGGDEGSRYAYGELSVPVIDTDNARPGVHRLEFSVAVRTEDYDTFGGVTTPKLGVIYDPNADFTVKASWGRSFKAPTLSDRYSHRLSYLLLAGQHLACASCAADDTVLMSLGGNPDLMPERARTWSASLAFHPEALPGLDLELTYFSIDYNQRITRPIASFIGSMGNPVYAEFFELNPSEEQMEQLLSTYNYLFLNLTGAAYDPSKVTAILYNHNTNLARQRVNGVDLTGSYRLDFASGQLELRGGASWLDLSQQNSAGQDEYDLSGMIFRPAELNSRFGAVWNQGGFSVSAFANYTSGVTSELTSTPEKIASFTTFDTTLRYVTASGGRPLSGLSLALSVDNIFNRAPPLYTPPAAVNAPYDSTNYSAIGRYVTISVGKRW